MKTFSLARSAIVLIAMSSLFSHTNTIAAEITSAPEARRFGLERSWVAQTQLDRRREKMENAVLSGDGLFVMSSFGVLEALDAETGSTRWIAQYGNQLHPGNGPGVGKNYLAMTKGTALYVVDRATGRLVMERSLKQVTMTSPTVMGKNIYVSLVTGTISTYNVSKPRSAPWYFTGSGKILEPPLATAKTLAWATTSGSLYASSPDKLGVRFQFQTKHDVVAPLGYQSPYIFVASRDGFVYAIDEINGRMVWRFAAGSPISQPPVAIRDSLFLIPEEGGMFCLSVKTGRQRWFTPQATQFLAASPVRDAQLVSTKPRPAAGKPSTATGKLARIYAATALGDTMILDADSGARIATMPTSALPWKMTNTETDRLYFATRTGLVECLHEIGLNEPVRYKPAEPEAAEATPEIATPGAPAEPAPTDSTPAETETPAAEADPFDDAGATP